MSRFLPCFIPSFLSLSLSLSLCVTVVLFLLLSTRLSIGKLDERHGAQRESCFYEKRKSETLLCLTRSRLTNNKFAEDGRSEIGKLVFRCRVRASKLVETRRDTSRYDRDAISCDKMELNKATRLDSTRLNSNRLECFRSEVSSRFSYIKTRTHACV